MLAQLTHKYKSMFDPTFGMTSLSRQLNASDFLKDSGLKNEAHKTAIISKATAIARNGFPTFPLKSNDMVGRKIFQVTDLPSDLVLRKAAQNIRRITGSKQGSRVEIIRRLKLFCEEGMPFTIAKMDIKSFYPSIDQDTLIDMVDARLLTAPSTRTVVNSLITQCKDHGISGIPPGLAISAELSEFYLQEFDRHLKEIVKTHYFARYVDDMVIILPHSEDPHLIMKYVEEALPPGLKLNHSKSKIYTLGDEKVKKPKPESSVDFLGYNLLIHQIDKIRPHAREVKLNIATSKVKKNKTRIVKSLLQYLEDGKFQDLLDRIRILTSGFQFFDEKQQKRRNAGIQHTYSLIPIDAPALIELDNFLIKMILSDYGPICGRLALSLSNGQKKKILKHSFYTGFANKVHFRFSADRLADLVKCWKYA